MTFMPFRAFPITITLFSSFSGVGRFGGPFVPQEAKAKDNRRNEINFKLLPIVMKLSLLVFKSKVMLIHLLNCWAPVAGFKFSQKVIQRLFIYERY